ncbi:creatininase family protein [Amycolatopsis sp. NPDC058986]|uniref:creatininase family protein n=1 Tax=unclassified Amycolatopsis TaxID=2618356 RepID=UPI00366EB5BD
MRPPVIWADCTREELREALPESLVVLPIGATEQHGPHLATGTDAAIVEAICRFAVVRAADSARMVLAPCLHFGVSEHHLPFGGTLSLSPETAIGVLTDLARSIVECGGRRLVIVNGHGGNRGVAQVAAAKIASAYDMTVSVIHYWELIADAGGTPIPGHAGEFETAMLFALRPEFVRQRRPRTPPEESGVDGAEMHEAAAWRRIDGYTDDPTRATHERGTEWLDECLGALAGRLIALANRP